MKHCQTKSAMIPIGSKAFASGKLIHTNELFVYIGSGIYLKKTACDAIEIVKRRIERNEELLENERDVLNILKEKIKYTTSELREALAPFAEAEKTGFEEKPFQIIEKEEEESFPITESTKPKIKTNEEKEQEEKDWEELMEYADHLEKLEREELDGGDISEESTSDDDEKEEDSKPSLLSTQIRTPSDIYKAYKAQHPDQSKTQPVHHLVTRPINSNDSTSSSTTPSSSSSSSSSSPSPQSPSAISLNSESPSTSVINSTSSSSSAMNQQAQSSSHMSTSQISSAAPKKVSSISNSRSLDGSAFQRKSKAFTGIIVEHDSDDEDDD
eukprot:MONOS_3509.1-p1 / transcript=MONOS_3509.1 / gene=MONOS_3509 / organism=Monocercomonoides_exilis_PA203 / gene_product=unspecified product / transcript_product=unspecified product / location=Mono_scaffold00083:47123-48203(+) / protein_length=326 / sequence_SO=supercontig / SO=protein_coding / is_pseudo=false